MTGDGYGYVYRWVDGEQIKLPAPVRVTVPTESRLGRKASKGANHA